MEPSPPFTAIRSFEASHNMSSNETGASMAYIYVHFKRTRKETYKVSKKHHVRWFEGNLATPDHNAMTGVKPFPACYRLRGNDAKCFEKAVAMKIKQGEPNEGPAYRPEVHPNEIMQLVSQFTRPGELFVDSTAGTASAAVAAIRLGRRVICVEKDKDTDLFKRVGQRIRLMAKFYKEEGLWCKPGYTPKPPTAWELAGDTWQKIQALYDKVTLLLFCFFVVASEFNILSCMLCLCIAEYRQVIGTRRAEGTAPENTC